MKIRNELNAYLYKQKMNEAEIPSQAIPDDLATAICQGDSLAVKKLLKKNGSGILTDERLLSGNLFIILFLLHHIFLRHVLKKVLGIPKALRLKISILEEPISVKRLMMFIYFIRICAWILRRG